MLLFFYFLLAIGFFPGDNSREGLTASIFTYSMFHFGCFFVLGLLFVLIRIFLRIKHKLNFFSIENIGLLIKLPVFLATVLLIVAFVLRAAI